MKRPRPIPNPSDEAVEIKEVALSLIVESDRLRLRQPPYSGVDQLVSEIRARGQTTPLFVRPISGGKYELISGYRRRAALEKLKARTALVRVFRQLDDGEAYDLAVSENRDRDDLTDMERGMICVRLKKRGLTAQQIATFMHWTAESTVYRYLRVMRSAPAVIRDALHARTLTMAQATTILENTSDDTKEQTVIETVEAAIAQGMSNAELKRYLRKLNQRPRHVEPEPVQMTRGGVLVLRQMRIDGSDGDSIATGLDVLEKAVKKARRMKRRWDKLQAIEPVEPEPAA